MKIKKIFGRKPTVQKVLAKTNVIELSSKYKYLIMFDERTGLEKGDIMKFMQELKVQGFSGIGLYMKNRGGVQLYKVENEKAK